MTDTFNIVILAAGKGTRLNISTPKPLCKALGVNLVSHVINSLEQFVQANNLKVNYHVITGHKKELVENALAQEFSKLKINFIYQEQQLGTGHAIQTFLSKAEKALDFGKTLVVCADTPLLTKEVFQELYTHSNDYHAIAATFETSDPTGLGRIKRADKGFQIIEHKDASSKEREIKEVNAALYIFETKFLKDHINDLNNENNSGEFYLTDLFKQNSNVYAHLFNDERLFLGVNDLVQLEYVESLLLERKLKKLMLSGVLISKSNTIYIEQNVEVGRETQIQAGAQLYGNTSIGSNCIIEAGSIVKDSAIENHVTIKAYSYLEGAKVDNHCQIGPMARLREGSEIADNCKIGNFVETKKSKLDSGVKISHLSYVGDAEVGENTNIGCGFITCNYDGAQKHKTIIGKNSFIGSDVQTIAPLNIGDDAYVGSGSTINKDVPDGAFAIARERQSTKPNMASKFLKKK